MDCRNHPSVPAIDRCAGCAEPHCHNCLVEVGGQKYCEACKTLAVQGRTLVLEQATMPCKLASEALTTAIVSLFCFGMILGPVAIYKASKARKEIDADPQLTGWGKTNAAIFIGIVGLLLWLVALGSRARQH